jgi:hypothetical protein
MVRRGAVRAQGGEVLGRGVAFVLREPVLRINFVPFEHLPVAFHFGDDRSRRNGNRKRIPVDERFLLDQHVELHGVKQQIIRRDFQLPQRFRHGLAAGLIDIPGVDAARINLRDRPGQSVFANSQRQNFAALGGQFLGIVQADDPPPGIQDDGRGNDGLRARIGRSIASPSPRILARGNLGSCLD